MLQAVGMMECIGYAVAMTAADAALKAANVKVLGYETVIGVMQKVSVVVKIEGDVAAVKAAVDAGTAAGRKIGEMASAHVIPRPHEQTEKIILSKETKESTKKKSRGNSSARKKAIIKNAQEAENKEEIK